MIIILEQIMSSEEDDPPSILVATRVDEFDGPVRQRQTVSIFIIEIFTQCEVKMNHICIFSRSTAGSYFTNFPAEFQ